MEKGGPAGPERFLVQIDPDHDPRTIPKPGNIMGTSTSRGQVSEGPKVVKDFRLEDIRITLHTDGSPPGDEGEITRVKRPALVPSMRCSAAMFLALTFDYATDARIILASHENPSLVAGIGGDLGLLYPRATIDVYTGPELDALYEEITAATPDTSATWNGTTYLLALGTTLAKHTHLMRWFRPDHALYGVPARSPVNYRFQHGEMWIPPFGGAHPKVVYIRTTGADGTDGAGAEWDASHVSGVTERFGAVTNERTVYVNPMNGADSPLFGKYTNDYSHSFALCALYRYLFKLGPHRPDDPAKELAMYEMLVRAF